MNNKINIKKVTGVSKKSGNKYTAFEVVIGKYRTRFFPTEIETDYIERILKDQARSDFKAGQDGDGDLDDLDD